MLRYKHTIKLFHLSNPLIFDYMFSSFFIFGKLTRLENVSLHNIKPKHLEDIVTYLRVLPHLSSLTINCSSTIKRINFVLKQVFLLRALKHCKLSFEQTDEASPLPVATTICSPIEYFTIIGQVYVDEVNAILSYIPQVRRLSISNIRKSSKNPSTRQILPIQSNYLTHLYLNMKDTAFDEFELIIKSIMCHKIQVLYISTTNDPTYADANRWQELIISHLPYLRIFDIKHKYYCATMAYSTKNNFLKTFNTSFWIERKWFFDCDTYDDGDEKYIILYSINPYKYKTIYFIHYNHDII